MSDEMVFWLKVSFLALACIVALGLIVASAWKGLAGEDEKPTKPPNGSDDWRRWRK